MSARSRTPMLSAGQENSRVARWTASSPIIAETQPPMQAIATVSKRRRAALSFPDRNLIEYYID